MTHTNPTDTYIEEFERHLNGLYLHDGEHTIAGAIQLLKSTLQKHRTEVLDELLGALPEKSRVEGVFASIEKNELAHVANNARNETLKEIRTTITNLKEGI